MAREKMVLARPAGAAPTRRRVLGAAGLAAAAAMLAPRAATAARRHLVVDPVSGLALGGFDTVAYFVDGAPRRGVPEHQIDWHGAAWLFVNEGNLAAFRERPDVYAPVFGGYCAFAVSKGRPAEGNPLHFALVDDRLYLFASASNRLAFLEGGAPLLAEAVRRWPAIAVDLP
jgi:hypothetical protein